MIHRDAFFDACVMSVVMVCFLEGTVLWDCTVCPRIGEMNEMAKDHMVFRTILKKSF